MHTMFIRRFDSSQNTIFRNFNKVVESRDAGVRCYISEEGAVAGWLVVSCSQKILLKSPQDLWACHESESIYLELEKTTCQLSETDSDNLTQRFACYDTLPWSCSEETCIFHIDLDSILCVPRVRSATTCVRSVDVLV